MVDIYNRVGSLYFLFAREPALHIPGRYEWHQCSSMNDVVIGAQVATILARSVTYYHFDRHDGRKTNWLMKVYQATHLGIEQHQLAQDNNQPNPELSWKLIRIYQNKFQPIVYNGDDDVNPNNSDNDSNGEDGFDVVSIYRKQVAEAVDIASPSIADDVEEEEEESNDGVEANSVAELVKTMSDCLGTGKMELGLEILSSSSSLRRHVAMSLIQHHCSVEKNGHALQLVSPKAILIVYNGDNDVNPNNSDNDSNGEDGFDGEEVAGAIDISSPALLDDAEQEEEEEEANDGVEANSAAELVRTMSNYLGTGKMELGLEIVSRN
ncbi:hypothetical protein LOK49_LG13G01240 [Camellia lanceoleosa]|uniref:Uncharacterized protein n=1 Tax=Camellia lanceoleosa TaxID=1840588 RepID=A0ACC0FL87_9ERIC|nr:hypothetical protein LOK49_LG13G01240 [Camellia lanceoleosa]